MYYDVTDYTVKFVVNKNGTLNGNTTDITYSLNSGDKFPTAPTAKANTGYEFSYWKDSNGNKVTSFPTTVTKSETYTAVWVSEEEKVNPNTGAEGTYVIGIMIAAAAMAVITGKKKK